MWFIERSRLDSKEWDLLRISSDPMDMNSIQGPSSGYPPSGFMGLPGMQARLRCDDSAVEVYDWAKIPVNPSDPESDMMWGWKLVVRNNWPPGAAASHLTFVG